VRVIKDPPPDLVKRRAATGCPPRSQGAGLLQQALCSLIIIDEADIVVANEADFGSVHRTLVKIHEVLHNALLTRLLNSQIRGLKKAANFSPRIFRDYFFA
jgi:hypothetical protein